MGSTVDGRWRIDALLGCGSTSAVYAATHRNGHRAALKIIHQALCADPVLIQRFLREAGLANAIKHRAIVPIGDDGLTEDGCAYLVLELLEGETLDAIRERGGGRISLEELAPIADELMSAISAVHAAGVVHRDLKPGNVFISKPRPGAANQTRGRLKLLDFGTARIFDREMDSSLSAAGLVMGTPAYMSPEQARGARAEVDAQSDVFALGAMIFTLLTGEHVHVGRDSHQQLLMAAMRPARFVSTADRSIDHRVAASIDRALAYSKKDRWLDVHSLRVAFRDAVVASLPAMRDLKAFVDHGGDTPATGTPVLSDDTVRDVTGLAADDDSLSGLPSFSSDPTLVMASPLRPDSPPGSDAARGGAPLVTPFATAVPVDAAPPLRPAHELPRREKRGIPIPALLLGTTAMAAAIVVVVFFMSGGDDARAHATANAAATAPSPATVDPSLVATTSEQAGTQPSFIEITAPDLPSGGGPTPKAAPAAVMRRPSAQARPAPGAATADAGGSSTSPEAVPAAKVEGAPAEDPAPAEPSRASVAP